MTPLFDVLGAGELEEAGHFGPACMTIVLAQTSNSPPPGHYRSFIRCRFTAMSHPPTPAPGDDCLPVDPPRLEGMLAGFEPWQRECLRVLAVLQGLLKASRGGPASHRT